MVVFCSVYFRLHYYFRFRGVVKRKTRIRGIGRDSRAEYEGRPLAIMDAEYKGFSPFCVLGKSTHQTAREQPLTASKSKSDTN
jgi:hypothetical protein